MKTSRSSATELTEQLCRLAGRAIAEYGLIGENDRILMGVSGGKDSFVLARVLLELQKRSPVKFELHSVTFDPQFDNFNADATAAYCEKLGLVHHRLTLPVAEIIAEKKWEKAPCVLCSRLRRGMLYTLAEKIKCNKLALGQHLDDIAISFLMSLCRGQGLTTMPPLAETARENISIIRPLAFAPESLISDAAEQLDIPHNTGKCRYHALLEDGDRMFFRRIMAELEERIPDIRSNILHSLQNVNVKYLLDKRF